MQESDTMKRRASMRMNINENKPLFAPVSLTVPFDVEQDSHTPYLADDNNNQLPEKMMRRSSVKFDVATPDQQIEINRLLAKQEAQRRASLHMDIMKEASLPVNRRTSVKMDMKEHARILKEMKRRASLRMDIEGERKGFRPIDMLIALEEEDEEAKQEAHRRASLHMDIMKEASLPVKRRTSVKMDMNEQARILKEMKRRASLRMNIEGDRKGYNPLDLLVTDAYPLDEEDELDEEAHLYVSAARDADYLNTEQYQEDESLDDDMDDSPELNDEGDEDISDKEIKPVSYRDLFKPRRMKLTKLNKFEEFEKEKKGSTKSRVDTSFFKPLRLKRFPDDGKSEGGGSAMHGDMYPRPKMMMTPMLAALHSGDGHTRKKKSAKGSTTVLLGNGLDGLFLPKPAVFMLTIFILWYERNHVILVHNVLNLGQFPFLL